MTVLRVLRVYHGGRDASHRSRDRALAADGIDVTLVVPASWHERGHEAVSAERFRVVELQVKRAGDVNRHAYADPEALGRVIHQVRPDLLDIHEEPFSAAARQWLGAAPADLPVVMYAAQNVDKRYPPPFAQYERAAYRRVAALYPSSRQAASVARGKGFAGLIEVLPLGYDDSLFFSGEQSLDDDELVFALFGRLVPEKGVTDAVRVLAHMNAERPARLVVVGSGPEEAAARELASRLGVANRLEVASWQAAAELAARYRRAHVVLVPSRPTETWVEQFGRVIVEAQASGAVVAGYASGSIPEVGGAAAVLTPVGDPAALADAVSALCREAAEYERRRRAGASLSAARTWASVAGRQAELYRRVIAGDVPRVKLPRSPRRRRAAARVEFGPTAETIAGDRPFAVPLLRRGGRLASALGSAIDLTAEAAARRRSLRRRSS